MSVLFQYYSSDEKDFTVVASVKRLIQRALVSRLLNDFSLFSGTKSQICPLNLKMQLSSSKPRADSLSRL